MLVVAKSGGLQSTKDTNLETVETGPTKGSVVSWAAMVIYQSGDNGVFRSKPNSILVESRRWNESI